MAKDKELNANTTPSKGAPAGQDHDGHGTPIRRVPGPGPKDAGKGAAGVDAIERVEGGLERVADQTAREGENDSEGGE
jgi:hypothetical protein